MSSDDNSRAWAEVDAGALAHNIARLQQQYGQGGRTRLMAVVKADAYGHGVALVAPLCVRQGARDFGVATVAEGVTLRALVPASATVFLLSPTLPAEAPIIAAHSLIPLISTFAMGQALAAAGRAQGRSAEAHLDVDTGMGRSGVQASEALSLLHALDALPGLRLTGLASHFARADEDLADARAQQTLFSSLVESLGARAETLQIHMANSPAALRLPVPVGHSLIRPGLLLYGIEPAPGMFAGEGLELQPVLSLKARVTFCRPLPPGATVSYGRTYTVPPCGGVYATLGIGYGDGCPRRLPNTGFALLHGRRAPIRGRVCMDQIVVDVSQIPDVQAGDTAILIGGADPQLTAGALAAVLGAPPHEITTCLTARIPRVLINSGPA